MFEVCMKVEPERWLNREHQWGTLRLQRSVMMERILLVLFILAERLAPASALRVYHHVDQSLTWSEAQNYCRQTNGDLATAGDSEELDQLLYAAYEGGSPEVWIGLYSKLHWMWSDGLDGSVAEYWNWNYDQPNLSGDQFCVCIGDNGRWWDDGCRLKYTPICYRGTQLDPEFVAVEVKMNWTEAQSYCRKNYIDLATVRSYSDNEKVQSLVPRGGFAWIGLFKDYLHWSDGSKFLLRDWGGVTPTTENCGYASATASEKLGFRSCQKTLPFVCQSLPPPETMQVVKLRMKLQDSVDLNNPAVKAALLEKLQKKLNVSDGRRVALRWRQQPNGKVFHKEEEEKKTEL